jgi:hypothetical protein
MIKQKTRHRVIMKQIRLKNSVDSVVKGCFRMKSIDEVKE